MMYGSKLLQQLKPYIAHCPIPVLILWRSIHLQQLCMAPSSVVLLQKVTDVKKDRFRSQPLFLKLSCSISVTLCNKTTEEGAMHSKKHQTVQEGRNTVLQIDKTYTQIDSSWGESAAPGVVMLDSRVLGL